MIDSQAVKNTCNACIESKGFCFYKSTNGIKRHLAVDTLGFPFFTHCTKANLSDDQGLIEMLSNNIDYFQAKLVNIPKITILLDNGYHPEKLTEGLKQIYPQIMTKIKFELCLNPRKRRRKGREKQGLLLSKPDGSSKEVTLGWRDAKVWSRILKELYLMPSLRFIFVFFD